MHEDDFEKLLEAVVPFAQLMLKENGSFVPFGAFTTSAGEVQLASGYGDHAHLETEEIMEMFLDAYRAGAASGEYRATALCADVRVRIPEQDAGTDAIQIMLEHADGESLNAYLPYKKEDDAEPLYAQLFATRAEPQVFVKLASDQEQ
jgi:hypothetical protein